MREYIYLAGAIVAEISGTTALKFSDGFSSVVPTIVVIVGYIGSFYLLSLTLQEFPIGLVYQLTRRLPRGLTPRLKPTTLKQNH